VNARVACLAAVAVHAVALAAHGQAHQAVPVPLSPLQNAFAIGVIVIAPLLAAYLIWRGAPRFGASLLVAALFGAFVFGAVNHYVLDSADHVAQVPDTPWGAVFRASAHGLAVTELLGVAAGVWLLRAPRRAA
jgi:hypothetical protein